MTIVEVNSTNQQATRRAVPLILSSEETLMTNQNTGDEDAGKGAVEQDRPQQPTNTSMSGQIGHRDQDPMLKSSNSDFPESGQNEEHTGEPHTRDELNRDTEVNPEGVTQDPDPGSRQKENQNKSKNDPLAA
jgi:hypothetical protein